MWAESVDQLWFVQQNETQSDQYGSLVERERALLQCVENRSGILIWGMTTRLTAEIERSMRNAIDFCLFGNVALNWRCHRIVTHSKHLRPITKFIPHGLNGTVEAVRKSCAIQPMRHETKKLTPTTGIWNFLNSLKNWSKFLCYAKCKCTWYFNQAHTNNYV